MYPAIITSLCQEKECYKVKTSDGVIYQKIQAHIKPYTHQNKMAQPMAQPVHNQPQPDCNPSQVTTSRPKRDTKAPVKLDL